MIQSQCSSSPVPICYRSIVIRGSHHRRYFSWWCLSLFITTITYSTLFVVIVTANSSNILDNNPLSLLTLSKSSTPYEDDATKIYDEKDMNHDGHNQQTLVDDTMTITTFSHAIDLGHHYKAKLTTAMSNKNEDTRNSGDNNINPNNSNDDEKVDNNNINQYPSSTENQDDHRKLSNRIVGGVSIFDRSKYPWHGIPFDPFESLCGASLISPDIMISAAHCSGAFGSGIKIGITDLLMNNYLDFVQVKKIYIHSEYDENTEENDIMLLQLQRAVNTSLIPLVPYNTNPLIPITNQTVRAIGFGVTVEGDRFLPRYLQQVDVNVIDFNTCSKLYETAPSNQRPFEYCMICAGILGIGGKDTCSGDSGGPLFMQQTICDVQLQKNVTQNVIVGLTSWGEGCARSNYPGMYTKVSQYSIWIKNGIQFLSPPTMAPSVVPSVVPSSPPTRAPTARPSIAPSLAPSFTPSSRPSTTPSSRPSITPSSRPSNKPLLPTNQPLRVSNKIRCRTRLFFVGYKMYRVTTQQQQSCREMCANQLSTWFRELFGWKMGTC